MPTLVLAAQLCPAGVEGTLFATLMSVYNAGDVVSQELGGVLTGALGVTGSDYSRLPLLLTVCALSSLLPLPFLSALDGVASRSGAAETADATRSEALLKTDARPSLGDQRASKVAADSPGLPQIGVRVPSSRWFSHLFGFDEQAPSYSNFVVTVYDASDRAHYVKYLYNRLTWSTWCDRSDYKVPVGLTAEHKNMSLRVHALPAASLLLKRQFW